MKRNIKIWGIIISTLFLLTGYSCSKEDQAKAEMEFKKAAWAYEMLLKRTKETIPFTEYWKEWESLGASWTEFWQVEGGIIVIMKL